VRGGRAATDRPAALDRASVHTGYIEPVGGRAMIIVTLQMCGQKLSAAIPGISSGPSARSGTVD